MPYVIAIVIIIIAAGALLLFREPAEAPVTVEDPEPARFVPEGFVPPTTPPPSENIEEPEPATEPQGEMTDDADAAPTPAPEASTGVTGTFVGEASYSTGRAVHELDVSLTLENNIVVAADIDYDGTGEPSTPILRSFNEAYQAEVIGKPVAQVNLSRVGGASWTSDAFNEAVSQIEAQL